jgi:heme A synthase
MFVRASRPNAGLWVTVHARGAEITIALALAAAVVAFWRLRFRRDLLVGSVVLTVLLILEAYLGGLITNHQGLEAAHFPLALALTALAVWLPLRARR